MAIRKWTCGVWQYLRLVAAPKNGDSPEGRRYSCCCKTATVLLILVVALVLFIGISAAVIGKIRNPSFDSKNATLESFNLNLGGITLGQVLGGSLPSINFKPQLSLTLRILLEVHNPNKLGLRFDPIIMNVSMSNLTLGEMKAEAFYLGIKKTRFVNATLNVEKANPIKLAPLLLTSLVAGKPILFDIVGGTKAAARIYGITTSKRKVRFECESFFDYDTKKQLKTSCKKL